MRALLGFGLASCVIRHDITHVVLRDPMNVEVANILPVGSARGEIPASVPPYIDRPEPGSWVERDAEDASDPLERPTPPEIVAWCPHCINTRRLVVIDKPALDLEGSAADLVRFDGDRVHLRWVFRATERSSDLHAGRHRRFVYGVPRIALDLVTPRSNVVSIDHESHVQRASSDSPLEIGAMAYLGVWVAGGTALGVLGVHEHEAEIETIGGVMAAIGITALGLIVREYRARDAHHPIKVR